MKKKAIASTILGIIASLLIIVGGILVSDESNSGYGFMIFIGMFMLYSIGFIWLADLKKKRR